MKNFDNLIQSIAEVHQYLQGYANRSVNQALTIRNWVIGMYIVEFEQNGADRASYGDRLLTNLSNQLKIKGLTGPELSRCRQFYHRYPQILGSVTQTFSDLLPKAILGSLTQELANAESEDKTPHIPSEILLSKLS